MRKAWFYELPKQHYRGEWKKCQKILPTSVVTADGFSGWWLVTSQRLLFYQWDVRLKDLAAWRVWNHYLTPGLTFEQVRAEAMSFLAKQKGGPQPGPVRVTSDKEFPKRWPCLWEYLTATEYPDGGGARKLATVSLFLGTTGCTACLNDRDNARSCFGSSASFLGALDALEAVARNPDAVWKEDRNQTGGSGRKKS